MKLSVPKETKLKENRVALTPDVVKDLVKKGFEVMVESGAGLNSFFSDEAYTNAGAQIVSDKSKIYCDADVVLKINAPNATSVASFFIVIPPLEQFFKNFISHFSFSLCPTKSPNN